MANDGRDGEVIDQVREEQVEGEEGAAEEEVVERVDLALLRAAAKMATTKKKNSSPTGAKKVMREASGPGLSFCGSSTPMSDAAMRLSNAHSPCHAGPAARLLRRRERARREVDVVEVGVEREPEVA